MPPGRAATKTAKVAAAKRASLENMVKMSEGVLVGWLGGGVLRIGYN